MRFIEFSGELKCLEATAWASEIPLMQRLSVLDENTDFENAIDGYFRARVHSTGTGGVAALSD